MTTAARLGTGELHCALEAARDLAALNSFCATHSCLAEQVSTDGRRLELPKVFDLMRSRGIEVAEPVRAPLQPKPGFTGWLVHIRMPRAEFDIGFFTVNPTPASAPPKHARKTRMEHA